MLYLTMNEIELSYEQEIPIRIEPDQIRYYSKKDKNLVIDLGETAGNLFAEEISLSNRNLNEDLRQIFDVGLDALVIAIFPDNTVYLSRKKLAQIQLDNLERKMLISDFYFVGMCKSGAMFNYNGIMALCRFEDISKASCSDYQKFFELDKFHKLCIMHKGKEPFPFLVSRKMGVPIRYLKQGNIIRVISTGIIYKNMVEVEITPNQIGMMIAPDHILKPIPQKALAIVTNESLGEGVPILRYVN